MKPLLPLLLAALLGLSQCHTHDPDPLDQLPPATQTGANTFGCPVNWAGLDTTRQFQLF